jgi:hypothetical protein
MTARPVFYRRVLDLIEGILISSNPVCVDKISPTIVCRFEHLNGVKLLVATLMYIRHSAQCDKRQLLRRDLDVARLPNVWNQ